MIDKKRAKRNIKKGKLMTKNLENLLGRTASSGARLRPAKKK